MAGAVAGSVFNAFAFAGAGFVFNLFDKRGADEEEKRHDLAVEKLQKEQDLWNRNEIEREDRKRELRTEIEEAKRDFRATNTALDNYRRSKAYEEDRERALMMLEQEANTARTSRPKLEDFYRPSPKMKTYRNVFLAGTAIAIGALVFYLV